MHSNNIQRTLGIDIDYTITFSQHVSNEEKPMKFIFKNICTELGKVNMKTTILRYGILCYVHLTINMLFLHSESLCEKICDKDVKKQGISKI